MTRPGPGATGASFPTTMTTLKTTLGADWAPTLEQLARQAAIALVAVYVAGWWLGHQVHAMNDWLAGKRQPRPVLALPPAVDPLLLDVRALRNAGLGYRRIARELQVSERRVRQLLQIEK